jgi:hypothetical protein
MERRKGNMMSWFDKKHQPNGRKGTAINTHKGRSVQAIRQGQRRTPPVRTRASGCDEECGRKREKRRGVAMVGQMMNRSTAESIYIDVKTITPYAYNKLAFVPQAAKEEVKQGYELKMDMLKTLGYDWKPTDKTAISARATVHALTGSAVCDDYAEMVVTEAGARRSNEEVHMETIKGHTYSAATNDEAPNDSTKDIIIDPWQPFIGERSGAYYISNETRWSAPSTGIWNDYRDEVRQEQEISMYNTMKQLE